jgi:crossover junction endodeoxyribonuclease RusA
MCIELELPYPPTLNHYRTPVTRKRKGGKSYATLITTPDGEKYKKSLWQHIGKVYNIDYDVHVSITLYPKTKAKYDVDNFLKALLDGLTECKVWLDDSQVASLYVEKGEVVKGGKVFVKISKK